MIPEWKGEKIGVIRSAHGLKGDLMISHHLEEANDFNTWDALMIELNPGSYIPFFIEEIERLNDQDLLCKVEEINSREEAIGLNGKNVYTSPHYHVKLKKENSWEALIGYQVIHEGKNIGTIHSIVNLSMNMLFQIDLNGKEILVPATEEFILEMDPKKKIITMQLPDGLMEL